MPSLIYCCGDSHTAGGETADDLLWPHEHPGFLTNDEIDMRDPRRLNRWREFRDRSLRRSDPVDWNGWQEREREQAWPARLGNLLGFKVINAGRIGSSMEWVARQAITDTSDLLCRHKPSEVIVILQPPTWVRIQIHDQTQGGWTSMQMSDAYGIDPQVHRWLALNETDQSLLTRWLISITGVVSTLSALGVRVILAPNGFTRVDQDLTKHKALAALAKTYELVCVDKWHSRSMAHAAQAVEKCFCPDLHWTREVHQRFAEDLATVI